LETAKLLVSKSIKYDSTDEAETLLNRITDGLESTVDPSVLPEAVTPEAVLPEAVLPKAVSPEAVSPEAKIDSSLSDR